MTFGEIGGRVEFKIWGNSTPDAGSRAVLYGQYGIIANSHQMVQNDHNYWFMRTSTTTTTTADVYSYSLPTDLKEVIRVIFKVNGEDYFKDPMLPMGTIDDIETQWPIGNATAEYPTHFAIVGDNIVIYPTPSEARTFHTIYWKLYARPTAAFTSSASVETDVVTQNLHEAITNLACAEMYDIREEFSKAQIFRQMANTNLALLKKKDANRRQKILHEVLDYQGV